MALGNTSASALINGARSSRNKQTAVNDQYMAYDFQNSAQTPEQFAAYQTYLKGQMAKTTDPSKQLSYQTKLQGANTSFTGNEIQRAGDSVMAGETTNTTKLAKIYDLYKQAQASGNENLAQNLGSQYMALTKTIQNEAIAAGNAADASNAKALAASKKGVTAALNSQSLALKIIGNVAGTGKPLTDENGNLLAIQPDGSFGLAPAGSKGTLVTARQAALAQVLYYQNKDSIYSQAQQAGLDDTGSLLSEQLTMQGSTGYKQSQNPNFIKALQSGDNAFTNKLDGWGTSSVKDRKIINWQDGHPQFASGFLDTSGNPYGKTGTQAAADPGAIDVSFNRKATMDPAAPMDNYTTPSYNIPTGAADAQGKDISGFNRTIVDPVTGKTLYVGTTPTRDNNNKDGGILTPGIPGTIPQTAEDLKAGKPVSFGDVLKQVDWMPGRTAAMSIWNTVNGHTQDVKQQRINAAAMAMKSTQNVMSPAAVARTTPTISGVRSPAQVAASLPPLRVVNAPDNRTVAVTPVVDNRTVKVAGPAYVAPKPQAQWWNPFSWGK